MTEVDYEKIRKIVKGELQGFRDNECKPQKEWVEKISEEQVEQGKEISGMKKQIDWNSWYIKMLIAGASIGGIAGTYVVVT